jgi:2-polyprenyl-3-methyl-5-hydroxy-6-metoxy-1,4-benzoquinol methylase
MSSEGTRQYFAGVPSEWDALYSHENRLKYVFNRLFRKGLFERYELTFEHCGDIQGASVLDVGCGTGRYAMEFARLGAARVVGVDFAEPMIDFSRKTAEALGVAENCEFRCGDFLSMEFGERFDIVIAMGFFDYIAEPLPVLKKIASLTRRVFLASFPRKSPVWSWQRALRYKLKKCPIYYYSRQSLTELYESASLEVELIEISHGFFATASLPGNVDNR